MFEKTPWTEEQKTLGIFHMQKLSFMRFVKDRIVRYDNIDPTMFFTVASLIAKGFIKRDDNYLTFIKNIN